MDVEFLRYQFQDGVSGVITKNGFSIGVRHLQMAYMFVSAVVMGAIRGGLGVAVLAMTDETRRDDNYIQIHVWDRRVQGAILSSFFFGFAMLSVPAELLLRKLSGKYVITAMLAANGALTVAMPTIANRGGWIAVCNAMLFMGMAHAGFSSVNQSLLDQWLPPNERKTFSFLIYGGSHLGIIIALPVSAILSQAPLGWELVFYSMAMMSLAMAIVYGVLTASNPDQHQAVGDKEKEFIREALTCYSRRSIPTPWRQILTSPHFWAVTCAHAACNAVFVFYLVDVPAYLKVFRLSLLDSGWHSVLPFAIQWAVYVATTPTLGWLSNLKLISYLFGSGWHSMLPFAAQWTVYVATAPTLGWLSNLRLISYLFDVTNFRKLVNVLGAVGVIVGLTVLSSLSPDWPQLAVILLTITMGSLGFQLSGFLSSYRDMSENHAGALTMLGSAVSSAVGAAVPFVSGLVVADDALNPKSWRPVLLYLASAYVLCNVAYTMLASNERQHWDRRDTWRHRGHYNGVIDANQVQLEEFQGANVILEKQDIDTAC